MNRLKKIIKNTIILVILFFIFLKSSGLYLIPLSAHKASERSAHYGPSEVVHIEDFDKGKYILCKYDRWFSCNTINKTLFFFWRIGNQVYGRESDLSKAVSYTWSMSGDYYKAYGIINDNRIKKIEVTLENGDILIQDGFYEDMFLVTWKSPNDSIIDFAGIRAYDEDSNIIFEDIYGY
ncbi:hypothetical protein SAMN02745784_01669 [Tissierella praeacuta DSM 18095]|uniref:Uncharacterized protein n=1 Tax=Tissierella praeacuta DSM 18095 TaxID=1123404 RepID=A0A1M4W1S2_9FIRM|nr:hypothetical protein [Tissierella praeacuta]TCU75673.1 hypothetical protein EV204_103231 [Tissierella praeacuta]SHE75100.1 hypothetical protein SAMN02745784_01669 [Tissierella praeacuta DSM 18095]SUP00206.1 Uncharacterised protein [Tissierella praeacuta]